MCAALKRHISPLAGLLMALLLLCSCQQRCQVLGEVPVTSIIDPGDGWRLVSGEPGVDKFNFYIIQFTEDFQVHITFVENNQQGRTPTYSGTYFVADRGTIVMNLDDNTTGEVENVEFVYQYRLTNRLRLNGPSLFGGFTSLELYPFEGIISPDNACEF